MVNFKTVTVGKACANAYEGNTLELSCQGGKAISEIRFASFGDPSGECGSYEKGTCEAAKSLSVVQAVSTCNNNNWKRKSKSIFFKCFFFQIKRVNLLTFFSSSFSFVVFEGMSWKREVHH